MLAGKVEKSYYKTHHYKQMTFSKITVPFCFPFFSLILDLTSLLSFFYFNSLTNNYMTVQIHLPCIYLAEIFEVDLFCIILISLQQAACALLYITLFCLNPIDPTGFNLAWPEHGLPSS